MTIVFIKEGQHIRDLAAEYLDDANLWPEILRANNLEAVTEIRPGMRLKIPSKIVLLADRELAASLDKIQEATKAGARILAPRIISRAIQLRDEAIEKRRVDWSGCLNLAKTAKAEAEKALKESRARSDISAEAVLNDRRGKVESRKPADLVWQDAPLFVTLIEGEKVRTLSQSTAEILFRDESRLRLNENSQAVIQKMRLNVLENKVESNVSLVEGDVYALLASSRKKKFDLEVPGVSVKIKSTNFWVNRDKETARIANYEGEIEVSSKDSTVVLQKNQGTRVRGDSKPTRPEDLLTAPKLASPEHHGTIYRTHDRNEIALSWEPVEGAVEYWLEVARDKSYFQRIVLSEHVKGTRFVKKRSRKQIEDGVYYWRVAAIDKNGFPGVKSEAWLVKILTDISPPYVLINTPKQGAITQQDVIEVSGETEGDATLATAGRSVDVSSTGKFKFDISLKEGSNEISLEFTDRAGNTRTVKLFVVYIPYKEIAVVRDSSMPEAAPNQFVARNSAGFTYMGRTEPDSLIDIKAVSMPFKARTFSEYEKGSFAVSVPLGKDENKFNISVTTQAGYVAEDQFTVKVDLEPPEIRLDQPLPDICKTKTLNLKGSVIGGDKLRINMSDVVLSDGRFDKNIELKTGRNKIRLIATDTVGNASFLEEKVIFDQEAPKLLKYKLSHEVASGGESVVIDVSAEDTSGMRRSAKFNLQVGEWLYTDYLKLHRATGGYQQTVNLPQKAAGKIELISVELEDYCGNRKQYQLN